MKRLLLGRSNLSLEVLGFSTNALAALSQEQIKHSKKEVPNGQLTKFELDRENGRKVYEVEVMDGNVEKEFKIDAETGEVIKFKTEKKVAKKSKKKNQKISYDRAKEIALKQSKNGKFKEIELKHKNGVLVYDVELQKDLWIENS